MHTIAIIGAGFSGTMTAVHLLRDRAKAPPVHIHLVERSGQFTAGIAYGTRSSSHLLNVPAGRMSAFEDEAGHFLQWARQRDAAIIGGSFVERMMYGEYLASVLNDAEAHAARSSNSARLTRVADEATDIQRDAATNRTRVILATGRTILADRVLLAIGNFPPADPPGIDSALSASSRRYAPDPWAPDALDVAPDEPVLLIGTGLTMLDMALALRDQNHRAAIHAISRRGLLPQPHRSALKPPPHHDRPAALDSWPCTAPGLLRALRNEIKSAALHRVDWREVVTSLRADTPSLWKSLSQVERERFLRHLRPFWETHRHRAAPEVADAVQTMISAKQLVVLPARIVRCRENDRGLDVTIRRRRAASEQTLKVSRIINCTGPDTDLSRVREPLIRAMRTSGLIRPDPLGLGLASDDRGALLDAHGRALDEVFLVGPLRKGQLWENTAVPELRIEAQRMAAALAESLASMPTSQIKKPTTQRA